MDKYIISARDLCRSYIVPIRREGILGSIVNVFNQKHSIIDALVNASFEIQPGELVGLIGPNGAGKSTTIKLLTGVLTPTKGRVELFGLEPHKSRQQLSRLFGAMFGQRTQLWWDLTPMDGYQMLRHIYSIPEAKFKKNLDDYVEILGIEPLLTRPVRKLSLGERVRSDLVATLLHDPQILFLDEPTIGLDVIVKEKVRTLLRHLSSEKKVAIILTSHDINDIAAVSSRIMILNKGEFVFDGNFDTLRNQVGETQTLTCIVRVIPPDLLTCSNTPFQISIDQDAREVTLTYDCRGLRTIDAIQYICANFDVESLSLFASPVEDLIRNFYQERNKQV